MIRFAIAIIVLVASTAIAQPTKTDAEAAYVEGQALYQQGNYEGAAEKFKAAFELHPDPVYLFNTAQALRLAKKCKDSGDYYRRYLDLAQNAPNADAVKGWIAEVDACAAESTKAVEPVKHEAIAPVQVPEDRPAKSNKRTIGYIVGGAGVAVAAVGVVFAFRVKGIEEDANALCRTNLDPCGGTMMWTETAKQARKDLDDKASFNQKLMAASFIVGGAAIATGVVLFVMGGEQQQESRVTIAPTTNGAMLSFGF